MVRRALAEAEERKKRRQAEEALQEQAGQLRALAGRLEASREEERRRISREIHDELGEALTSQKLGLMWIKQRLNRLKEPEVVKQVLEKIDFLGTQTDGTAKRVRRLCTELRPPILDDLGLTAAIEWQAREFQNRTSIECVIHPDNVTVDLELEPATALFPDLSEDFDECGAACQGHAGRCGTDGQQQASYFGSERQWPGHSGEQTGGRGIIGHRGHARTRGVARRQAGYPGRGGQRHDGDRVHSHQEQSPRTIMTGTKHSSLETAPEMAPVTTTRPLRILIADDHAVVRDGLKQLLADRYANAIFGEAANTQQALDKLDSATWDVMLLDLTMPGRGGLDVLAQARTISRAQKSWC